MFNILSINLKNERVFVGKTKKRKWFEKKDDCKRKIIKVRKVFAPFFIPVLLSQFKNNLRDLKRSFMCFYDSIQHEKKVHELYETFCSRKFSQMNDTFII